MLIEEVLQDCQKVKIGKWLGFQAILCKSIKIKIMAIIAKTSMIGKNNNYLDHQHVELNSFSPKQQIHQG